MRRVTSSGRVRKYHTRATALAVGLALGVGFGAAIDTRHAAAQVRVERNVMAMPATGGMGGGMARKLTKADLGTIANLLKLNDDQRAAAEGLLDAYLTESKDAAKASQDALKALREDMDADGMREHMRKMGEAFEQRERKTRELKAQFMNDLKAILTPQQAGDGSWERLERWDRRREMLSRGQLAGETLDLFALVQDAGVAEPHPRELTEALSAYEMDLDAALQARERARERHDATVRPQAGDAITDMEQINKLMSEHRKMGVPVRDVNLRHAAIVGQAVPEAQKAKYEELLRQRTYPRVYKPSHAAKSLDAASRFSDLDAQQKSAIESLMSEYARSSGEINTKWAAAIADEQKDGGGTAFDFLSMLDDDRDAPAAPNSTRALSKQRKDLDRDTLKRLRETLRKDQTQRLPKKPNAFFEDEMMGDVHIEGEEGAVIHAITVDGDSGETTESIIIQGGPGGDGPGGDGGSDGGSQPSAPSQPSQPTQPKPD